MKGVWHNEDFWELGQQGPGAQGELARHVLGGEVLLEAGRGLGGVDLEDRFIDKVDVAARHLQTHNPLCSEPTIERRNQMCRIGGSTQYLISGYNFEIPPFCFHLS